MNRHATALESLESRKLMTATQIDLTFGQGGYVFGPSPSNTIYDMAVQPDGKVLAAGTAFNDKWDWDFGVARYNPDGTVDTSFGENGLARVDFFGLGDRPYAMKLLADGKILAAGEADTVE